MFGPAGTIYVYRSYGIHWCVNIVTGTQDDPQAVLLRGGTVIAGRSTVVDRRSRADHLADGPGKLAQCLGITGEVSGSHLSGGVVDVSGLGTVEVFERRPRIGLTRGKTQLWRFLTLYS